LNQKIVCPELQPLDFRGPLPRRHQNYGNETEAWLPLIGLDDPTDLDAAEPGHFDVHQNQIRMLLADRGKRLVANAGLAELVAEMGQPALNVQNLSVVVVDDQDPSSPHRPGQDIAGRVLTNVLRDRFWHRATFPRAPGKAPGGPWPCPLHIAFARQPQ